MNQNRETEKKNERGMRGLASWVKEERLGEFGTWAMLGLCCLGSVGDSRGEAIENDCRLGLTMGVVSSEISSSRWLQVAVKKRWLRER